MLLVGLRSVPPDWFRVTVFSKSLRGLREPANRHRIQQGTNHQSSTRSYVCLDLFDRCAYCTRQILHVTVSVALWHCIRCFSKPQHQPDWRREQGEEQMDVHVRLLPQFLNISLSRFTNLSVIPSLVAAKMEHATRCRPHPLRTCLVDEIFLGSATVTLFVLFGNLCPIMD
jgi:hypothetical protein